jgi:hypothetical protein
MDWSNQNALRNSLNVSRQQHDSEIPEDIEKRSMERGDGKPLNEDMILMSSRKSSIEGIQPKDSITSQYE